MKLDKFTPQKYKKSNHYGTTVVGDMIYRIWMSEPSMVSIPAGPSAMEKGTIRRLSLDPRFHHRLKPS